MAATYTITLTAGVARLPFTGMTATSGVSKLTASGKLLINSGAVALMPKSTSAFTMYNCSCLGAIGTGKGRGFIGVDKVGVESALITTSAIANNLVFGQVGVERFATSGLSGTLTVTRSGANTVKLYDGIRATGGASQGLAPS